MIWKFDVNSRQAIRTCHSIQQ